MLEEEKQRRAGELLAAGIETLGRICQGERPPGFCRIRASQLVSAMKLLAHLSAGELPEIAMLDMRRINRLRELLPNDVEPSDILDEDLARIIANELPELLPLARAVNSTEAEYLNMPDEAFNEFIVALGTLGDRINQKDRAGSWLLLTRDERVETIVDVARELVSTNSTDTHGNDQHARTKKEPSA